MEYDSIQEARKKLLKLKRNIARCPHGLKETYRIFFDGILHITIGEESKEDATDIAKSILLEAKKIIDLDWEEEKEEYFKGFIMREIINLLGHVDPTVRITAAEIVADVAKTHCTVLCGNGNYKVIKA